MKTTQEHTNSSLLVCDKLTCGYTEKHQTHRLVKSFSATVEKGELICLIGVNGAGKSTLLKTVLGLKPPLQGVVKILDKENTSLSTKERAKNIGAVLTNFIEEQYISAEELVALGRFPYTNMFGNLSAVDLEVVHKYMKLMKVWDKRNQQFHSLSDGEKQKAILAKILCQETPLILLDEPTAHLDIPNRIHTFQLLRELVSHEKKSIIVTTHNLELALELSDKIWLIDTQGNVHVESPEDLYMNNKLQEVFSSEKIKFNKNLLQFRMQKTFRKHVYYQGDKSMKQIVQNLLERHNVGFTNEKDKSVFTLVVTNNPLSIVLSDKDRMQNFSSFASLQSFLRNKIDE